MGELDSFLLFGSESSRAERFTRVRVAKPTNTPLEPTAEKRGGSAAIRQPALRNGHVTQEITDEIVKSIENAPRAN